jgi:hypothetical protein
VQNKQSRVFSLKGKKQVASLTSSGRGRFITIVNAVGTHLPPLIIFPRKHEGGTCG